MSRRIYPSGAKKRTTKTERDEKDKELLKKIPKLSDIFREKDDESGASQMSSALSTTETVENSNITEQSEDLENAMECDVVDSGESSFQQSVTVSTSSDIESNDPGVWDIKSKQKSLQSYWVKHGKKLIYVKL